MEELVRKRINHAIKEKVFPGCVVGVVSKDGERHVISAGNFTYEDSSPVVQEDTIYDVASLTKSIPTGSLALQLIDQRKLKLTDKLIKYVPEFNNSDRDHVVIKHLLTYTIDGYGVGSLKPQSYEELFEIVMTRDFEKPPGTIFKYTNIPAFLLAVVVERVLKKDIELLAQERFFEPLEMTRTTYDPDMFPLNEIVPTEIDHWRGLVHGVVHDESAYIAKTQSDKVVGHAGVFSTAPDILNFLEMLLHGGKLKGNQYFSKELIETMHTNQIPELNLYTGLGWELYQPRYMGKFATEDTFAKTGFTGCLCVCDMQRRIAYVILSNRIFPQRPKDSAAINSFRADIGNIIFENLTNS